MEYIKNTFSFGIDYLFDVAKLRSANIANHIAAKDGTTQERNLALTDSERNLWDVGVRYPANDVYNYLMSAGQVKEGDYQYGIPDATGKIIIQYTLYLHPDWDKNLTRGLGDLIERSIVSGGLADWYKSSMSADAYNVMQSENKESLAKCKLLISRRKYMDRRPHVTF